MRCGCRNFLSGIQPTDRTHYDRIIFSSLGLYIEMDMLKAMLFSQKAEMLGNSLTVELRTLTPSVLVRIQVPQPIYLLEKIT